MKDLIFLIMYLYSLSLIIEGYEFAIFLNIAIVLYVLFNSAYLRDLLHSTRVSLNEQKEQFIQSLKHEIKIPAIAQLRSIEHIKKFIDFGEYKDLFLETESSCRQLVNLVSMLINNYEISQYKFLKYSKFDMSKLVHICIKQLVSATAGKNLTVKFIEPEYLLNVEADEDKIKDVILNLLYNAINFSRNGDEININLEHIGENIKFSIKGVAGNNSSCLFKGKINPLDYDAVGDKIRINQCRKIIHSHKGRFEISLNNCNAMSFLLPCKVV